MKAKPKKRHPIAQGPVSHAHSRQAPNPFNRVLAKRVWGETNQPPFLERLPGFFFERVATPRSKLTF